MGKVFNSAEMQQRKIPELGSFPKTVDFIRKVVEEEAVIIGGLIIGSALMGRHTIRSDVDFLYWYHTDHAEKVIEIMRAVNKFASELFVPVDFIPLTPDIASQTVHHTVGPSFKDHLLLAVRDGGVINKNPLEHLPCRNSESSQDDAGAYVGRKLHNFEKGVICFPLWDEPRQCLFFQKVLEAPVHIAMKVLFCFGVSSIDIPTKGQVVEAYSHAVEPDLAKRLEDLVQVDTLYSNRCNSSLRDGFDPTQYSHWLADIGRSVPMAIEFARLNLLLLATMN